MISKTEIYKVSCDRCSKPMLSDQGSARTFDHQNSAWFAALEAGWSLDYGYKGHAICPACRKPGEPDVFGGLRSADPEKPKQARLPLAHCAASRDGECNHEECPQNRDGEPEKSGRHCPIDHRDEE